MRVFDNSFLARSITIDDPEWVLYTCVNGKASLMARIAGLQLPVS